MSPTPFPPDRRRRAGSAALAVLLLLTAVSVAGARGRPEPRTGPLETSLSTRYDEQGHPVVSVTVSRAYRAMVFTRTAAGNFAAELRVTVIARRDGRQVAGAVRSVRAVVSDAEASRTDVRLDCTVPVALDGERPVELDIRAEVVDTSRWWNRKLRYAPGGGGGIPWYFTTFAWNLTTDGAATLSLAQRVDSLRVDVGLSVRPGDFDSARPTRLVAAVRDAQGAERILEERALPPARNVDSLVVRIAAPASEFPFGLQTLAIRLEDDRETRLDLSPDHELVNLGVPFTDDSAWRRHVGWLEEIVTEKSERRALSSLPAARRAEAWRLVWVDRGPDQEPNEAEHLGRIVEADRRFGRFGRGALSDRGRTMIRYGRPDKVDHHGMDPNVSGEWEVWYYREKGLRVVFYDPYALGDYRLYAETRY